MSTTYTTQRCGHFDKHIYIAILVVLATSYRPEQLHRSHTESLTQNRGVLSQCLYVFRCRLHCVCIFPRRKDTNYFAYMQINI